MHGCGVQTTTDINPIYVWLERSCPKDSKNVSYVGVGLDFELGVVVGWPQKNLVSGFISACSRIVSTDLCDSGLTVSVRMARI